MRGTKPAERRLVAIGAVAIALLLCWVARAWSLYGNPLADPPVWAGWYDQSRYAASAAALANGDLTPASHWYPLAYPALAAPFTFFPPHDPFVPLDLLLFVLTGFAFARAMRPLGLGLAPAAIIYLLSNLGLAPAARTWIQPWTTTLSACLTWALLACLMPIISPEPKPADAAATSPRWRWVAIGALATALPLARPAEIAVSAVIGAFTLLLLVRRRQLTMRVVAAAACGGVAVGLPYLALHLAIYGPHVTDYMRTASAQGFAFADLYWKAYVIVIAPRPWFPGPLSRSMIENLPFLLPGAAGLIGAALTGRREVRLPLSLVAVAAITSAAFGLAYTDLQPPGLWRFGNVHYFKWLFPLFGAGCWFWLRSFGAWKHWAATMTATLALLLVTCVRILPVRVADDRPARMLRFRGDTKRDWSEAFFAKSVVRDSKGSLINVGQFHQVPDDQGQLAISVIRPFARHPQRRDPGEPAPFGGWQSPYARYGERISFGLPCWVDDTACRLDR